MHYATLSTHIQHALKHAMSGQVLYTLDVSQYTIGAKEIENFYLCINKALQKCEPDLLQRLAGYAVQGLSDMLFPALLLLL